MSLLGKILVFVNLGLSFLMAGWALSVYVNRVDFSNTPAKEGQPPGEMLGRKARVEELSKALGAPLTAWRVGRASVLYQEGRRGPDRLWYADQLEHLRSADAEAPIRTATIESGLPVLDATGRPKLSDVKDPFGKPLRSLAAYNQAEEMSRQEIDSVLGDYKKQIEEDKRLTQLMLGPKGLQQRLADEKAKREGVVEEQQVTRPLLINTVVESGLILKRRKQLEARIEELKKVGVAADR